MASGSSNDWKFPGTFPLEIQERIAKHADRKTASAVASLDKISRAQPRRMLNPGDYAALKFLKTLSSDEKTNEQKFTHLMHFLTDVRPKLNDEIFVNETVHRRILKTKIGEMKTILTGVFKSVFEMDSCTQACNLMHLFFKLTHFYNVPKFRPDRMYIRVDEDVVIFESSDKSYDRGSNRDRPLLTFVIGYNRAGDAAVSFSFKNKFFPYKGTFMPDEPDIFGVNYSLVSPSNRFISETFPRIKETLTSNERHTESPLFPLLPETYVPLDFENKSMVLQNLIRDLTTNYDNSKNDLVWSAPDFVSRDSTGDEHGSDTNVSPSTLDTFCEQLSAFVIDNDYLFTQATKKTKVLTLAKFVDNAFLNTTEKFI